jgi:hypothetical protein
VTLEQRLSLHSQMAQCDREIAALHSRRARLMEELVQGQMPKPPVRAARAEGEVTPLERQRALRTLRRRSNE